MKIYKIKEIKKYVFCLHVTHEIAQIRKPFDRQTFEKIVRKSFSVSMRTNFKCLGGENLKMSN